MNAIEFASYDGLGLAELVRRREVSAAEMLDVAIARIEEQNPAVNAVVTRLYDQARAAVAAGLPDGPFMGVPYLLKDLGAHYTGAVTSFGSALFQDFVADHDSEITVRLKRAGLVIVGKTNTPELGLATSTEPRLFGPTRNPWNHAHTAGGSSGGSAAAVAAGMVPMAHGNDGGGSIRIPASCCGLFGLKPTRARNPMGPDAGEGWGSASVGHAITRTVRDSAALLDATSGPDVGDPYWAPPPAGPFLDEVGRDPGRLRIAISTRPWNGQPVDPECVLTPTMCRPPYPLGVIDMMTDDEGSYMQAVLSTIAFTSLFNTSGNPAMSVPLGWSRAGLPIGVQFAAPFGDEATLFRLGARLEAEAPWAHRRAPAAERAESRGRQ